MRIEKNGDIFDIYIDVKGVEDHYTHPVEIDDCSSQAFPPQKRQVTKEQLESLLSDPDTKLILLSSNLVNRIS